VNPTTDLPLPSAAPQLYEMIIVRHGLMIVGYSYGAKTSMYRTLAAALTQMKARGANEEAATFHVLNPKVPELYMFMCTCVYMSNYLATLDI